MDEYTFTKEGFEDYRSWIMEDRKTVRKINELLEDIRRNGALNGIGKPEALKSADAYSRRIDQKNRLVYQISEEGNIRILSCKGHYEDLSES